jgi:hypothetical protein
LRPMTRDARLSALHRGGFGLRGRASLTATPLSAGSGSVTASSSQPGRNAWRAASLPPETTVTSRRRGTPHLAPPSGCLRTTPLKERGCESSTTASFRSQQKNANCSEKDLGCGPFSEAKRGIVCPRIRLAQSGCRLSPSWPGDARDKRGDRLPRISFCLPIHP